MEFQKKIEVQYKNGAKTLHTFEVLSVEDRNRIFGEYIDMRRFMKNKGNTDVNPAEFIKDDKNILDFTTAVLKAGCPTLEMKNIPAMVSDKLFEELNDFLFTGGLKN